VGVHWLTDGNLDSREVGDRAAVLARLASAGLPVPVGFVLGHEELKRYSIEAPSSPLAPALPRKLPAGLADSLTEALAEVGGAVAVRRSPLDPVSERAGTGPAGRPERETYLNLLDSAEVIEAIRRIWSGVGGVPPRAAVLVMRFVVAQVSAIIRRDRADDDLLHVQATYGVGDLLAAGLVVPDRYGVHTDGSVQSRTIGRKAQMTIAKVDGGIVRVPVPANQAREASLDAAHLAGLADLWKRAELALGGIRTMSVAFAPHPFVTGCVGRPIASDAGLMLG
jgi:pyruvate,water dikinase